jgi:formylglycine-generating enzyme required for sulfatase activity
VWNARPENRQLPSLLQWLQIRWLTQKKTWTLPQRKMMRKATHYHAMRGLVLAVVLAALSATGWMVRSQIVAQYAAGLVQRLVDAETPQVPGIIEAMEGYRNRTDSLLRDKYQKAKPNSRPQLHASLALLPMDATQVEYLYKRLLDAEPHEVPVIRDALAAHKEDLVDQLWAVVEAPEKSKETQRLRAAAALATYDPDSQRWRKVQEVVANDLVSVPSVHLGAWLESFRPVRAQLRAPLAGIFREAGRRDAERSMATDILADYAADRSQLLADLLLDADEKQFALLFLKVREQGELGLRLLIAEMDRTLPGDVPSSDERREKLAKRQANAAVALLRMNRPEKVWPLLKHRPDPRARSYLIHRLAPLGADAGAILQRLDEETDMTIRRALLLGLGEYSEKELSPEARQIVLPKMQDVYRTAADPGLHAATEWLLRTWQQETWLKQVNDDWAKDQEQQQKRLQSIQQLVTNDKAMTPPQWYVNGQGQTLVVITGPVEFVMGSPSTEEGRWPNEWQHKERIGRTFALAAKPVTVEQYRKFDASYGIPEPGMERWTRTLDSPVIFVTWFESLAYCNWLSKQENIPEDQWCYETNPQGQVTKLKKNYLSLAGYRLPTEAEWEYACRAGAATSRYYGEREDLLEKYAWYGKNSQGRTWPVGSKKPNDLGLFDLHGNAWCWCQEPYKGSLTAKGDHASKEQESDLSSLSTTGRLLRGGSFFNQAWLVRCAYRLWHVPADRLSDVGLRPARTFAP